VKKNPTQYDDSKHGIETRHINVQNLLEPARFTFVANVDKFGKFVFVSFRSECLRYYRRSFFPFIFNRRLIIPFKIRNITSIRYLRFIEHIFYSPLIITVIILTVVYHNSLLKFRLHSVTFILPYIYIGLEFITQRK